MLAFLAVPIILGSQNYRTFTLPPTPKPREVRIIVVDEAGKPVVGCPIAVDWKKKGSAFSPVNGVVTGSDGSATFTTKGFEAPIAYYRDRMGYVLWDDLEGKDSVRMVLSPTTRVKLNPLFGPKLRKGERMPFTAFIKPGEPNISRSAGFFQFAGKAGFELPIDGYGFIDLPQGSYIVLAQAPGVNTMTSVNMPQSSVDIVVHWEPSLFNKPAPPMKPTRTIGKFDGMEALKGKWVYVDFWATWCKPCIEDMPRVIDFYKRNAGKRSHFEILSVHSKLGSEPAAYKKALGPVKKQYWKGRDLPFPILFDGSGKIGDAWRVSSIPSGFLIDPTGKVVRGGLSELQAKLDAAK